MFQHKVIRSDEEGQEVYSKQFKNNAECWADIVGTEDRGKRWPLGVCMHHNNVRGKPIKKKCQMKKGKEQQI